MGYDLHITRADDWSESEQRPINWDEWCDVVDADPELRFSVDDRISFSNQPPDQPLVEWNGSADDGGAFYWYEGRIVASGLDKMLIAKMLSLAGELGATVQGDDGERYSELYEPLAVKGSSWIPLTLIAIVVAAAIILALFLAS